MPFCCIQHLSDVQAIFPAFAANSIVIVATILHVHCIAHSWLSRGTILVSFRKTTSTVATLVKNITVKSFFAVNQDNPLCSIYQEMCRLNGH